MVIRKYHSKYLKQITQLFYETVHAINNKDYTEQQLSVWATGFVDVEEWDKSLHEHFTYVAFEKNLIVGFGDITSKGYLDRLFVHKDYQNKGIATAICNRLESSIRVKRFTVHASITAKSFFESRGYKTIKMQDVEKKGIILRNYLMEKQL